jgi:hypothetical protein
MLAPMGDILKLIWWAVIGLFRLKSSLEAEILTLRHQLNVLRRKSPKRLAFQMPVPLSVSMLYGNVTIANFILKPLLMAISEWRERSLVIFPLPRGRFHLHSL